MWFLESPKPDVSHASVFSRILMHPVFFSPPSFFLFMFVLFIAEIHNWQIRPDASYVSFLPSLFENKCFYSMYVTPFIAIPRSRGIKSHFSAAWAVIPCCQSPLYCRSCICSCLVLSIDDVGAADASTGTIMQLHKPVKLHFPIHGSAFFETKGEERLNKYVYLPQQQNSKLYANTQLLSAYGNIFM